MNLRRIALGTVVLGIAYNLIDYVVNTYVIAGVLASLAAISNPAISMTTYALLDFAGAFMLMLAWDKIGAAFGTGVSGGMKFGAAAGAFIAFPMFIALHVQLKDFSYSAAWIMTFTFTVTYALLGAGAGMLDGVGATVAKPVSA